jgi:hypothetical protein
MPNDNDTRATRPISRLASLLNYLLRQDYNIRDVYTFKWMWPEQHWWMMDFVLSRPDVCRHVNDPTAAVAACRHAPRCRCEQLRCIACDATDHYAFHGCPVVDSLVQSMRAARCSDEQLLLAFSRHSFNDAFRIAPGCDAITDRRIRNSLAFIREARNRSYVRRCVRQKFDL